MTGGSVRVLLVEKFFEVRVSTDALFCGIQSKGIASDLGFGTRERWEIAIAVQELITNAVSHAGGGRFTIRAFNEEESRDQQRVSLEIEVEDDGPGIEDFNKAVVDGYSRGRLFDPENFDGKRESLGAGLGTVLRLMDSVRFENKRGGGLLVRACKYLTAHADGRS
jgi:serine/threonine-protein kinase RsbT